jgi:hypothetical protein
MGGLIRMAPVFKMNKRVFNVLAYLQTIPQGKLTINRLNLFFDGLYEHFGLVHDETHFDHNLTVMDIKNISKMSEPLTGKVALVDITSLVKNGMVKFSDPHVVHGNRDENDESGDFYFSWLHQLHKVKINPKACATEGAKAKGLI